MVDLPEDSRKYVNTGFAERLDEIDPEFANVIIEARDGQLERALADLRGFEGVDISEGRISDGRFIPATVPEESIPDISRLSAVELVHQDQLSGILNPLPALRDVPFLTPENDPIRTKASDWVFESFTPDDQYLGSMVIDEVEVPRFNFAQIPPGDPVQTALAAFDKITGSETDGKLHIPTSDVVDWILDGDVLSDTAPNDSKTAILDTGHTPLPDANGLRAPKLFSKVPGEVPFDYLGHGSWCTNMAVGREAPSAHGSVGGVAPGATYSHVKCLNSFPGVGRTSWILAAMDEALSWGADVISMSLGGEQQGPVEEDPYARFIRRNCKENAGDEDGAIFVVAAGNSGPDGYTIGSPGVAPEAITVGSWSLTDDAPAVFSSRGPQGAWYVDHPDRYKRDLGSADSDMFVKPDVVAPGGGRENEEKTSDADELLHQVSTGWMEGMYDGLRDARGSMKGTSMATPGVDGLVYRLYDEGIISTAADVKTVVRDKAKVEEYTQAAEGANTTASGKNVAVGFGPIRESLFAG